MGKEEAEVVGEGGRERERRQEEGKEVREGEEFKLQIHTKMIHGHGGR